MQSSYAYTKLDILAALPWRMAFQLQVGVARECPHILSGKLLPCCNQPALVQRLSADICPHPLSAKSLALLQSADSCLAPPSLHVVRLRNVSCIDIPNLL